LWKSQCGGIGSARTLDSDDLLTPDRGSRIAVRVAS
jgi:hypothetical protein